MALFFVTGLRRGLIRQVLEVLGLVAAFIGAFYLAHHLAGWLEGRFDISYRIALVIAATALFTGIVIAFHFIGLGLQKLFKMTVLGWFDRIMGGVFGALKGAMLVSLILVILMSLPVSGDLKKEISEDPLTGAVYPVLPVMFDLVMSHTGTDFDSVARIGAKVDLDSMKEKAGQLGERLKEEKDRLDEKSGGD